MKYKGLDYTTNEWIMFNDKNILTHTLALEGYTIRVRVRGKVYTILSKTICNLTSYKDFSGNDIYDKDFLQYETYNASTGANIYHIRQIHKAKDNKYYLGKAAGFSKVLLQDLFSMSILNAKVIGNKHKNPLKEGNYQHP